MVKIGTFSEFLTLEIGNYSKFSRGEIGTFSEVLITFRGERLCGDRVFRYLCIAAIRLLSGDVCPAMGGFGLALEK